MRNETRPDFKLLENQCEFMRAWYERGTGRVLQIDDAGRVVQEVTRSDGAQVARYAKLRDDYRLLRDGMQERGEK